MDGGSDKTQNDVYERLRDRLDRMAKGFPATENGAEIKLLRQLFTPEDAAFFLAMGDDYETSREVAGRMGGDPGEVAARMEDMAKRGLLFRLRGGKGVRYRTMPFIVGIYEFQVDRLDMPLAKAFSKYFVTALAKTFHDRKLPYMRTIPIETDVVTGDRILPIDDAVSIVKNKKRISVAACLCRQAASIGGRPCKHPAETCLQFDAWADYYVENGRARYIAQEDALAMLRRNEKEGLVIQAANSRDVEIMCSCCSCCCGMLVSLKFFPGPSQNTMSNYVCRKDDRLCANDAHCVGRCPSGAHSLVDGKATFDRTKCIGCGLCVTTCPSGALVLERKPEPALYLPPPTLLDAYGEMERERKG